MIDERDLLRHLEEGGDDLWNRPDPPALDLAAITGEAAAPAAPAPEAAAPTKRDRARPRWWRPVVLPPAGFLAGAMACVALGLGLGLALPGDDEPAPTQTVASTPAPTQRVALDPLEAAPQGAKAVASVFATSTGDTINVRVAGMPPLPPGSFYELWALGSKGRMVSLGNISVDANGNGAASVTLPVSLSQFPVLDISREPADGNPAHSGSSLLRSPA